MQYCLRSPCPGLTTAASVHVRPAGRSPCRLPRNGRVRRSPVLFCPAPSPTLRTGPRPAGRVAGMGQARAYGRRAPTHLVRADGAAGRAVLAGLSRGKVKSPRERSRAERPSGVFFVVVDRGGTAAPLRATPLPHVCLLSPHMRLQLLGRWHGCTSLSLPGSGFFACPAVPSIWYGHTYTVYV